MACKAWLHQVQNTSASLTHVCSCKPLHNE